MGAQCLKCGFNPSNKNYTFLHFHHILANKFSQQETPNQMYNRILKGNTENLALLCSSCHAKSPKTNQEALARIWSRNGAFEKWLKRK